jgi:3-mercaptopyruvate sulfurtransferase SseA
MVMNGMLNTLQAGTIKTSLNLPAQSFYQARKTLLELCDRAGIKQVIFYCGEGVFFILIYVLSLDI